MEEVEPLTWERVRSIREEYSHIPCDGPTQQELADKYNTTQSLVCQIVNDKIWTENEHAPAE